MTDEDYRKLAREIWAYKDEVEMDYDAQVSKRVGGAWVAAWVWVDNVKETSE